LIQYIAINLILLQFQRKYKIKSSILKIILLYILNIIFTISGFCGHKNIVHRDLKPENILNINYIYYIYKIFNFHIVYEYKYTKKLLNLIIIYLKLIKLKL